MTEDVVMAFADQQPPECISIQVLVRYYGEAGVILQCFFSVV